MSQKSSALSQAVFVSLVLTSNTRLVGRFRSGAALMRHEEDPGRAEDPHEINYFAFGAELPSIVLSDGTNVAGAPAEPDILRGRRCPVWSHIRKVNPRDLGTDL